MTPCLHLLRHFLGVRGREDADFACGLERVGKVFEKAGDGIRETDRSEHAGAE